MRDKPTLQQLVAFSILMENGQGIVGKSPDYITEKFDIACICGDNNELRGMLDIINQAKFNAWLGTWISKKEVKV